MPIEALDQVWVENESNDYELGHSMSARMHQYVCGKDEYIQY